MAATGPLKELPFIKEWMAQADPPKEACAVKKNEWPVAASSVK